jgi:hypothetical protein
VHLNRVCERALFCLTGPERVFVTVFFFFSFFRVHLADISSLLLVMAAPRAPPAAHARLLLAVVVLVLAALATANLFPPRLNTVGFATPSASLTCGVDGPTNYCDVGATGAILRCNTQWNCTNTTCPHGSTLPAASDLLAASVGQGAVSVTLIRGVRGV